MRLALAEVAEHGLPGKHHFYITFETNYDGVDLPDYLRSRYPEEMTIVLQHQYWGLEVEQEKFSVTVSFSGVSEQIVVPYAAVRSFADPSVSFGLRFDNVELPADEAEPSATVGEPPVGLKHDTDEPPESRQDTETGQDEKVVTLDQFRRK